MKIPEFKIRTDLALEEREGLKEAAEEVSGVSFKKWEGKRSAANTVLPSTRPCSS